MSKIRNILSKKETTNFLNYQTRKLYESHHHSSVLDLMNTDKVSSSGVSIYSEEYQFNGKPLEIIKQPLEHPRYVMKDDELPLYIADEDGNRVAERSFRLDRSYEINELFMVRIEDEFGYKQAVLGGFGELKKGS
jgi:hypothetical protein